MNHRSFLKTKLGTLPMKNPVMPGSGTYGREMVRYVNPELLGGVVTSSVTLHPKSGSPAPRLVETPSGILTAVGLQSAGINVFLRDELPFWRQYSVPLIVSLAGESTEEFLELAEMMKDVEGISAVELNLSLLRVKAGELFLNSIEKVIHDVRKRLLFPIIAKLSPHFPYVSQAKACEESGADAVSLVYGFPGLSLDVSVAEPKLGSGWGILAGPAIRPLALGLVWQVASVIRIPVIGMGGIFSADDALEFLGAGAKAVAVGTATLVNPKAMIEIIDGLADFCVKQKMSSITELSMRANRSEKMRLLSCEEAKTFYGCSALI